MLGVILVGLWLITFALILLGYRPGGPVDILVGVASVGPILVALAAVRWPPVARSPRVFAFVAWLALLGILLLVPSIAGLVSQLQGRGAQTLLPSAEAAYPWALALLATSVFAGIGVARRRLGDRATRARRLVAGIALGVVATLVAGSAFTAAAVYNELSLGQRPANSSRFGPTDPTLEPPPCDGPLRVGSSANVTLLMDTSVDGKSTGQATLTGQRSGTDIRWDGYVASSRTFGRSGFARVGADSWLLTPGDGWTMLLPSHAHGSDMDRELWFEALATSQRKVVEDVGLAYVDGARARHCRIPLDGTTLRLAVPEVDLLVGDLDLSRWRGELDFWVFADDELGQASGYADGPGTGLAESALTAEVRFTLFAIDRDSPITVLSPT